MQVQYAIVAKNISKTFHITEDKDNTVKHRLFNILKPARPKKVHALKAMNFEVKRGECVGLIGSNGCGKSTLTRILSGVYSTDTGDIKINGTTMLMQLGVGMSHELTARENIYVSSSVLGLKIKQVDDLFDEIVDFAEIREFVDTKIKYFSAGMKARLAFSIAVNAGADIMFLDEIFAVGDIKFQEKAMRVFEMSWIKGRTVILVSHSMDVIQRYCNRTAYMKDGALVYYGDTNHAINLYKHDSQCTIEESLIL
jgi:ABC-2 type transport system ATP-binding protein